VDGQPGMPAGLNHKLRACASRDEVEQGRHEP
jgi:hypothetical protein